MDNNLHHHMIKLSNNSPLTGQAAAKLSELLKTLPQEDKNTVMAWFHHAEREQDQKISNAKRNNFNHR